MAKFQGATEDALGPFLGGTWWKKGGKIEGLVQGTFETSNGMSYSVQLRKPINLDGEDRTVVSLGNLTGFVAAMRAARLPNGEMIAGDVFILECTGITKANRPGYSDQPNFKITVDRN